MHRRSRVRCSKSRGRLVFAFDVRFRVHVVEDLAERDRS